MAETIAVGSTDAYLATPELGAGPAVLVITEPADAERRDRVCDEFAEEGFTALAPDLRNGHTAGDLEAAVDVLKPHPAVRGQGIGVVGFGAGGGLAEWLGAHRPGDVMAVVAFAEDEDERLVWIRTLEYLRKHLG
jgi:carboxymethylenebutenolidase